MSKEKQVHAIVVFGDVTDFGIYFHRITNFEQELLPFIRSFDKLIDEFEQETGYFVKRLGDGFMCVVELSEDNHGEKTVETLDHIWQLGNKAKTLIKRMQTPRPSGFRIRVATGYVWRIRGANNRYDYIGYHVNLCEKMLEVHKDQPLVSCQNFKENTPMKPLKSHGYTFKKLANQLPLPEGVYKIDLNSLWSVRKGD